MTVKYYLRGADGVLKATLNPQMMAAMTQANGKWVQRGSGVCFEYTTDSKMEFNAVGIP